MASRKTSLHELPRFTDKLTYIYVEHATVEQASTAISLNRADGSVTLVPAAALAVLLLGPGTTLTHSAVKTLAENNCQAVWVGEHGVRFYAHGLGGSRSSRNLLRQAFLSTHDLARVQVVVRMYCMRFADTPPAGLTLQQLRGREGIRVRESYATAAREFGVAWSGRRYERGDWNAADPVNRALSAANACLYGLCHAAIVSGGYSTALGFIHTGKQMSFVYDVADLYKAQFVIPVAFREAAQGPDDLETRVRRSCRDSFRSARLAERILPDIGVALDVGCADEGNIEGSDEFMTDESRPAEWWKPSALPIDMPIGQILSKAVARPWVDLPGPSRRADQ